MTDSPSDSARNDERRRPAATRSAPGGMSRALAGVRPALHDAGWLLVGLACLPLIGVLRLARWWRG